MFPSLFNTPINSNLSFMDFWLYIIDRLNPDDRGLANITCWAIWGDRNLQVHGPIVSPPDLKCALISS